MSNCVVDERERCRRTANALRQLDEVVGVDLVEPSPDIDSWHVVADLDCSTLGPDILELIASTGLSLHTKSPQGALTTIVVTV